jgi:hypothetical protein
VIFGLMLFLLVVVTTMGSDVAANDPKPTTRYDAKSASDSNRKPAASSEAS